MNGTRRARPQCLVPLAFAARVGGSLGASIGLAAFDPTLEVRVVCATEADPEGAPGCDATEPHQVLDAVRRTGVGFGGVSIGVYSAITRHSGLLLRSAIAVTVPRPVTVFQPTVGYAAAF